MPINLIRVDERLIHGQVVLGWGSLLRPDRYVVVDDAVAASDWEQELYVLGLPDGVAARFLTVERAAEDLQEWRDDEARTVILTRNVETVLRLAAGGRMGGDAVNIGGIHHGPGRVQVLSYVYLDDLDRQRLAALVEQGVSVTARDLPGSKEVELASLLA